MSLTECPICGRESEDEDEICVFCDDYEGQEDDDNEDDWERHS